MEMVIAVPRDADNNLTNLYTGYDFSAGKAALVQANPPTGYVFRGDPSTAAFATMRQPTDRPPVTPSVQSAVMDGHVGALVPGTPYGPQLLPDLSPAQDYICTISRIAFYESVLNGPPVPLDVRLNVFVSDNAAYPNAAPVQITDDPGILGNDIVGATQASPLNPTGGTIVLERNQTKGRSRPSGFR